MTTSLPLLTTDESCHCAPVTAGVMDVEDAQRILADLDAAIAEGA